jgi:hypothetical protein
MVDRQFSPSLRATMWGVYALLGSLGVQPLAQAACTPASPVTVAGTTVSCTGATAGQYLINAQNVTLTNTGAFTASGALTGVIVATQNLASGVSVINQGSVDWTNAQYGGSGTGTRSVANVGYTTGNNFASATFLNETGASMSATVTTNLSANRYISGASLYAINGLASATNRGSISVTTSSTTASSGSDGIDVLGRSGTIVNGGSVLITTTGGAGGYGLAARATAGAAEVTNTGSVIVDSVTGSAAAVSVGLVAGTTAVKVTNSNLLEIKGGTAASTGRSVVELGTIASNTITQEVENQAGGVIRGDIYSYAIRLVGANTAANPVRITNAGTITGPVLTLAGADRLTQTAGSLTGDVTLGAGADTMNVSGGALVGSSFLGDGDDQLTLSGSADVTQVPQFDGGAGTDTFTADGLTLRVYTAAVTDPAKGNNLTLWETINANNGAQLRLTGDLSAGAGAGTVLVDASSVLNVQGETVPILTIQGNVNLAGSLTQANGAANNVTTVTGSFVANGTPTYVLETVLGNDASTTDKLVVNGDTSGTTTLQITNLGGAGAATINGIEVVRVNGNSAGTFVLPGPGYLIAGVYRYDLVKVGNNWFLQSKTATAGELGVYPQPVPVLTPFMLSWLGVLLGFAGFGVMRRQRQTGR